MAILEDQGFEATVEVNGVKAIEYDQDDTQARGSQEAGQAIKVVSKYVESTEGAEFAVRINLAPKDPWVCGAKIRRYRIQVFVDGVKVEGRLLSFKSSETSRAWFCEGPVERGERQGEAVLRKMTFAAVKTDENTVNYGDEDDSDRLKNFGLIEVRIQKATTTGCQFWSKKSSGTLKSQSLVMAEQSLKGKAISHGMSLASSQPARSPTMTRNSRLVGGAPEGVFKFYYRSKKDLQQLLIIPRDPMPAPASSGFDSLPHPEILRLAREKFDSLSTNEVMRLADRKFGSLSIAEIMRLADETFNALSMADLQDLARERFQQNQDT
ncbi:uncharacterized protein E0L32_006341 [Thyridium curvatum]|uniref:DUF7918 domain-containing protein n=1 Tax=Thyridium curvatum TaxID=1093900 RepID=A0A507B7T9_9PEZI|nr:uncharacterized protein E0L32_006341 [Thyridium curvatum]TPX13141.1 hypothetical protein E0L32_006341 [Thyridium curvatum]